MRFSVVVFNQIKGTFLSYNDTCWRDVIFCAYKACIPLLGLMWYA